MEEKTLQKLEYREIIAMLVERCTSQLGKELAAQLKPSLDLEEIKQSLSETTQAKEILRLYPDFSLGGVRDIRRSLNKVKIGGMIEPSDFLEIADTLFASNRLKRFFQGEQGQKYDLLAAYCTDLPNLSRLEQEIKQKITEEGEVSDAASPELSRIRKQLRSLRGKVRDRLESMLKSPEIQKYLQDPLMTIRDERYVLPVKQEYRAQVPGLVHDQSASGATLFIEPLAVVEINNEIRRYEAKEKSEVMRILRQMSQLVAAHEQELQDTIYALTQVDFILAKGKLSNDLDCGEPLMNNQGYLKIVQGRHPLLKGEVVPITVYLGKTYDILIITGPNTGGKTVALKTVGLFVLMAQSGLHVPAQTGTELSVFTGVYADIGDEQSIEQSLSTFSSHLTNIVDILDKADSRSLVLLDELGAGTDPTEGAALAMAILEYLIDVKAKIIATTHYSELKSFAFNKERVENASVEFDVNTLRPTFRLLIGIPGKSNAFAISQRLGLKKEIVERARGFLSQEEVRTADLIANLETNQLLAEKERQEAQSLKRNAQELLAQVKKRELELKEKEQTIIQKAQLEALNIVADVRRESESILKEVRKAKKLQGAESIQKMQEFRQNLREKEDLLADAAYRETEGPALEASDVEPGMTVLIKRINQQAQVLAKPNANGEVLVQAGIMKVFIDLKDLQKIEKEETKQKREKSGIGKIVSSKAKDISNELHLRGMTVDEALFETEKYLDDAYLAGLSIVRIIHGKGTGTLRKVITDLLKKHNFVASYRLGGYHEGGHGVTIVELKKQ
ncbi:MAG: endonuclease MutS2 [Clostridia bacterium]|nr:endonuclease MutS2 [Clostridia bacterium]